MLGVLKRLFKSGKQEAEEIPFSTIELWFDKKIKETSLTKELSSLFNEITEASTVISSSLKRIARKKIESTDHVEEHREDYILKMQTFLKQISLEKKDVTSILNYGETLPAALNQIEESTNNHFSIIKELFPDDAENIASAISSLENTQEELNEVIKKELGLMFVHDVNKMTQTIKKKNKIVSELKEQIIKEEAKQEEAKAYKIKLETDHDNLKSSEEYEKYDELLSKKLKLEKELERENENTKLLFSPISKILEEYDKRELGSDRALARSYVQDPLQSLHNDKNLWVLNLLQSVADKLPEIEPDEEKRIKLRQSILSVSENTLKDYLSKAEIINDSINQLRRQLMLNNTTNKIEDIKYKLNHANGQARVSTENKQKHLKTISEVDIKKDLLMLEKKLNTLTPVKIT